MTFEIESIKYKVGEKSISVRQICLDKGRDFERLLLRSGFETVHRTSEPDTTFFGDFLDKNLEIREKEYLILVNQSMASLIPGKVSKLFSGRDDARTTGFLEISDGCTGFARALVVANSILESGLASRLHIVCAEKYSQYYDDDDDSVSPIFSDAISVTTLTNQGRNRVIGSKFLNFFDKSEAISVCQNSTGIDKIRMEGARVLTWAIREIPKVVFDLLAESGLSIDQVNSWYVHQGSKIVVDSLLETLGVDPTGKFTSSQLGNTVSSTIPITLSDEQVHHGNQFIPKGYAVFLGFGVGLSIVAVLLEVMD